MILLILLIVICFSIILAAVWMWFFKNEKVFCDKLYYSALEAMATQKYKRAKGFFLKAIQMTPDYKDSTYQLGCACFELGEYDEALGYFEGILKTTPKNIDALNHLALVLQEMGRLDEAKEAYSKVLKEDAKNGDCLFGLGFISYKQCNYEEAIEFFVSAEETYTDKVKLTFYMAKCRDELSDYEEESDGANVIEAYLKIANAPNLPSDFNISLANAYAKTGKIQEALKYCKKSLSENPEDVQSYKLLGLIQLVQKDFVATKNTLSTALHLQPNNAEIHNILSYVLCQQIGNCELQDCRDKYHQLIKKFLV